MSTESYATLAARAARFDRETQNLHRQKQAEIKQWLEQRKKDRAELLRQKQAAFVAERANPQPASTVSGKADLSPSNASSAASAGGSTVGDTGESSDVAPAADGAGQNTGESTARPARKRK